MGDNATFEEYQRLLDLGTLNAEDAAKLKLILSQAEALQGNAQAPRSRQAGNVVVPPHWMEMVGGLAQQGAAVNKQKQAQQMMEQQRMNQQKQQALMLKMLGAGQQPWTDAAASPTNAGIMGNYGPRLGEGNGGF